MQSPKTGTDARRVSHARGVFLISGLGALLLSGFASAEAVDLQGWDESAGVQLMVGDSLDPAACVYDSPDYQQTLVLPGVGEEAYLLALKAQTVTLIPRAAIEWDAESRPAPDLSAGEDLGLFTSEDGVMSFDGTEAFYQVQPEPPLVGDITYEKLRSVKPDYVVAAKRYQPEPKAIAALAKVSTSTQIEIFFGSWCSHCKHWVPRLMRVLDEAANPNFQVAVHAMSEDQSQPEDSIRKYDVSKTPTIVVVQNGRELGRIEEEPLLSIEADLVRMLGAK